MSKFEEFPDVDLTPYIQALDHYAAQLAGAGRPEYVTDLKKGDKIAVHDLDGKVHHITVASVEPNGPDGIRITPEHPEAGNAQS